MRVKINLDTFSDCQKFVDVCSKRDAKVYITDGSNEGLKVSAKSLMGALYSLEFDNIWCESDKDMSGDII